MKKVFYILMCMLTLMQSVCSADTVYSGCVLGGDYAVVASDGLIGDANSGVAPTSYRSANTGDFYYTEYVPDKVGTVNYVHVYVQYWNGDSITIGLYNTSGDILAYANSGTIDDGNGPFWLNYELNTEVVLSNETYYCGLVPGADNGRFFITNDTLGAGLKTISMSYATTLSNADFSTPAVLDSDENYYIVFDNQPSDPTEP